MANCSGFYSMWAYTDKHSATQLKGVSPTCRPGIWEFSETRDPADIPSAHSHYSGSHGSEQPRLGVF